MPIRVNLKEIFPSDPQEINVEKLNFNFNKLLELGVGSTGPIGLTGPQGPAGPIGLVGPQGDRGATWWVDSGDPNTLTFTGLIDGDLYLDQTSTTFEVYQYDDTTSTWNSVVSIAAIVNAYLSTAAPSPFTTGPTGIPTSSTKFVIFDNQGNPAAKYLDYVNDATRGTFNTSNNKSLFLANFDENILDTNIPNLVWPANQNSLYNSLFKIVAAHDDAQASVKADLGRYHLEFGSLYNDGTNILLSDLKHNLKGKFYKRYLTSPELASTNEWINTAKFSLSLPEPFVVPDVDQNGEFEFVVPKYNNEGSLVREEVYIRIGSAESFEERTNKAAILADGISITNDQVGRSMVVGLREDLGAVLDLPYSSTNFALFDVSDDVDGLFFNKTLVQTGGNIDQLITTPLTVLDTELSTTSITTGHYMNQGIIVSSNTVFISSGAGNTVSASSNGLIIRYDISKPNAVSKIDEIVGTRQIAPLTGVDGYDQHGHRDLDNGSSISPNIGLIKDIDDFGRYFVGVLGDSSGSPKNFIIGEIDSRLNNLLVTSYTTIAETLDGYRVQVNGKYAWVITNKTTVTGPQLSSGSPTYASLTAIDLSNPGAPVVSDSYLETQPGTKYLDFKIADNKAYVLRYTNYVDTVTSANSIHSLDLLTFDVLDPTSFSELEVINYLFFPSPGATTVAYSPADVQNLETLTVNTTSTEYGGLEVCGNDVYVCWKDKMYIINVSYSSTLVSTTTLSSSTVYANDIKVAGNYVYTLVNYPSDSKGAVQAYDIRNTSLPLLCSETKETSLQNSSRLAIHGKNIYAVSSTTGSKASLISLDLHGISSPSAEIGSLLTSDLHIANSAIVRNNLHVKNALNVGPGGIYIDRGQGLSSDGVISVKLNEDTPTAFLSTVTGDVDNYSLIANQALISNVNQSSSSGTFNQYLNQKVFTNSTFADILYLDYTNFSTGALGGEYNEFTSVVIGNRIGSSGGGTGVPNVFNAFTGTSIDFGGALSTFSLVSDNFTQFIGSNIQLSGTVDVDGGSIYGYRLISKAKCTNDVYGLDIQVGLTYGFFPSQIVDGNVYMMKGAVNPLKVMGTAYGLHITGAEENLVEGTLTLNDHEHLEFTNTTDISQTSQNNQFVSGQFDSSNTDHLFTRVGDVVTCTGNTISSTINIPLGQIDSSRAWGVASWNNGGSGNIACRVQYKNATQVEIRTADGATIGTGTMWFTFSYAIA